MILSRLARRLALVFLLFASLLGLACNKDGQARDTGNSVYGKVSAKNEPFKVGLVKFYTPPSDKGLPQFVTAAAISPDDGSYEAKNLPTGDLLVVIDVDFTRPPGVLDINDLRPEGGPPVIGGPPMGPPKGPGSGPPGPPPGFMKGIPKGLPGGKGDDPNEVIRMSMPFLMNYSLENTKLVVKVAAGRTEFNIHME
jgi:hypothetical protein